MKQITPPESEPLALSDVEAQIQYPLPDDQRVLVGGFISAIRQRAEVELHRAIIAQTWEVSFDAFPTSTARNPFAAIILPLPPLQSVESVTYTDQGGNVQTLAADAYVVDDSTPARILPAYGTTWPETLDYPNSVRVRFKCGYGDDMSTVPACIRQWMLLNVANLYEHRETLSLGMGNVLEMKTLADSLLDPERWEVRV